MIGDLPVYNVSSRPKSKIDPPGPTESEVWDEKYINNANLLRALVEDPDSQVIWEALLEE